MLLAAGTASLASALQRGARRRGYPSWSGCRCVFRTEPVFHVVLWGLHAPATDTLLVLSVVRPPAPLRRALHHGAQWCAVLHDAVRSGHAPYVVRIDIAGATRAATWLPLFRGGPTPDTARPGVRRLRLERREADNPAHAGAILRVFREPRSGQVLLKNCCASRSPVGTRVDCIGPSLGQISYCTARLPHSPTPSPSRGRGDDRATHGPGGAIRKRVPGVRGSRAVATLMLPLKSAALYHVHAYVPYLIYRYKDMPDA